MQKEAYKIELQAQKEQCEFDLAVQKDHLKHTFTLAKAVSKDGDNTTSIFRTLRILKILTRTCILLRKNAQKHANTERLLLID